MRLPRPVVFPRLEVYRIAKANILHLAEAHATVTTRTLLDLSRRTFHYNPRKPGAAAMAGQPTLLSQLSHDELRPTPRFKGLIPPPRLSRIVTPYHVPMV